MSKFAWHVNTIATGNFSVEADRTIISYLGELAAESKLQQLKEIGPTNHYRFYLSNRRYFMGQTSDAWDMPSFLEEFGFDSLEAATSDRSGMNPVMCAVLCEDMVLIRQLAEARADVNIPAEGCGAVSLYDGMTPLIVAARTGQSPQMLSLLVDLKLGCCSGTSTKFPYQGHHNPKPSTLNPNLL